MKFAHRLNVRALSAMVTGIMVASSMLASAAPVAAVTAVANVVTLKSGTGVQGSSIGSTQGTFTGAATNITYLWWRCANAVVSDSQNNAATRPSTVEASCVETTVTKATYTLSAVDVAKPYLVAEVSATVSAATERHYSASFAMKAKPALVTTAPAADHYPFLTEEISDRLATGDDVTVDLGDWIGEPEPTFKVNWVRCSSSATKPTTTASCTAITAADGGIDTETYTVTSKDVGYFLRAKIVARNTFGTVTLYTPSWTGGHATASNDLNKVSGVPFFSSGAISASNRKATTGTWKALPTVDTSVGYTSAVAIANGHTSGDATPGYAYQWYSCLDAVELQSNSASEWTNNNQDGQGVLCEILTGYTDRWLPVELGGGYFVVKVTATNARGSNSSWSKSFFFKY